jgi:hypothetical protein
MKMMNRKAVRVMKKISRLYLMYRLPRVVKAMSHIYPSQQLLCVMSQHQVVLTGGYIT